MKIIRALVENFKRIDVVEVTPAGDIVEITGKNRAGKSSLLDAIEAALGGKRRQPKMPIRKGKERARVVVDLGDIVVERIWTGADDRLVVKNKDGYSAPGPQRILNDLVGGLAFDPLAFMESSPADQRETLLRLCGVDLDEIEVEREEAYSRRRDVGRDLKAAEARLSSAPEAPDGTPVDQIPATDLTDAMEKAMELQSANEKNRGRARSLASMVTTATAAVDESTQAIEVAEEAVRDAEAKLRDAGERRGLLVDAHRDAAAAAETAKKEADALTDPDIGAIRSRLEEVEETNANVRMKIARETALREVRNLNKKHADLDQDVSNVADRKAKLLSGAKMPIEGLSVTDDGIALDGIPFEQSSMSQRVRVCTAISAALNPKLRIALVRSGNDLDEESLAAFYEECGRAGIQPWVERIAASSEGAIVIEDGRVAGQEEPS